MPLFTHEWSIYSKPGPNHQFWHSPTKIKIPLGSIPDNADDLIASIYHVFCCVDISIGCLIYEDFDDTARFFRCGRALAAVERYRGAIEAYSRVVDFAIFRAGLVQARTTGTGQRRASALRSGCHVQAPGHSGAERFVRTVASF